MKFKNVLLLAIFSIQFVNCAVYRSPNNDDPQYWRENGEKYLKKILKSQGVKSVDVAKNVIIFVGDGMSFATITAGRILKGQMSGKSGEETNLNFESFPHMGMAKTYNINSQVPDSAGTATAIFSGVKAPIKSICLNPAAESSTPDDRLRTFIDWAQVANKRTGIVTTTRITHATPASTYAYSSSRNYECDSWVSLSVRENFKDIARQLVEDLPGRKLNVIFGGGRDFLGATDASQINKVQFSGGAENSCNRTDGKNLVERYLKQFDNKTNAKYVKNSGEMLNLKYEDVDHVMGLFANNHMSYNSLRDRGSSGEPSLSEMTKAAIKILNNKKNKNGFALMVEGGRIDMAHHQNHARLALEEFVEFEKAIQVAIEMTNEDTLIIVTADHAHAMIMNGYGKRGNDINEFGSKPNEMIYETLVYATGPGYWKHMSNSSNETFIPLESFSVENRAEPTYMHSSLIPLGDATHSGEDVGVFAIGKGSKLIQGVFEQNYIAYAISFSTCIGPVAHLNPSCSGTLENNGNKLHNNLILLMGLQFFYLKFHIFS